MADAGSTTCALLALLHLTTTRPCNVARIRNRHRQPAAPPQVDESKLNYYLSLLACSNTRTTAATGCSLHRRLKCQSWRMDTYALLFSVCCLFVCVLRYRSHQRHIDFPTSSFGSVASVSHVSHTLCDVTLDRARTDLFAFRNIIAHQHGAEGATES